MNKKWYQYVTIRAALIVAAGGLAVAGVHVFQERSALKRSNVELVRLIAESESQVERLKHELTQSSFEIQRLETQIAPFRAIAVERFGESGEKGLSKLANQVSALEAEIAQISVTIRTFEVHMEATVSGDWMPSDPPDLGNLFRTSGGGSDIGVEILGKDGIYQRIDFVDTDRLRLTENSSGHWVLDYSAKAPAGSWIYGVQKDDLVRCRNLEINFYGINHDTTKKGNVVLRTISLTFYVNGIPAFRSVFAPNLFSRLEEEHGKNPRVRVVGPAIISEYP